MVQDKLLFSIYMNNWVLILFVKFYFYWNIHNMFLQITQSQTKHTVLCFKVVYCHLKDLNAEYMHAFQRYYFILEKS